MTFIISSQGKYIYIYKKKHKKYKVFIFQIKYNHFKLKNKYQQEETYSENIKNILLNFQKKQLLLFLFVRFISTDFLFHLYFCGVSVQSLTVRLPKILRNVHL